MTAPADADDIAAAEALLARNPNDVAALERLAIIAHRQQRFADAAAFLRRALAAAPSARLHYYLGGVCEAQNDLSAALGAFEAALALEPNNPAVLGARARLLLALARYEEALEGADKAVALAPQHAGAWFVRGQALTALSRSPEARQSYERAAALAPRMADDFTQNADRLLAAQRPAEALAVCDAALALNPTSAALLRRRGVILFHLDRDGEAEPAFRRSLELDPRDAETWLRYGDLLSALKRGEEAMAAFTAALGLKPDLTEALEGRGAWRADTGRYGEAAEDFEALMRLDPDNSWAPGRLLAMRRDLADWRGHAELLSALETGVATGRVRLWPFDAVAMLGDPALQLSAIGAHAQAIARGTPLTGSVKSHGRQSGKIRLGYVSGDFHAHAVAYLIAGVFEAHDRARFELVAFATNPRAEDAMRARLSAAFDEFVVVPPLMPDAEVAALIQAREIDIAIDLSGFTLNGRVGALAHRPAPVQVNYLGFPGTLGAEFIDYIIADRIVIPPEAERYYAERVVRLPHVYQANTAHAANAAPTRASLGLPERGVVMACFNNALKLTPEVFEIWVRLLKACESAVLWLFGSAEVARHLRAEAARSGVARERLVFADFVDHAGHLARLTQADFVLDTWPYGAHTTASDALWMGVPVVTWTGRTFASRVATSLVRAAGAPELAADSPEGYEKLALALARDPARIAALKRKLAGARQSPLFDTVATTRALETAYEEMMRRARAGLAPAAFDVAALR